ncbi:hypothetical protein ACLQ2Y_29265 [Micromonospora echinospora]|uniref:hypothetical protein n=1 Tax=Micromonospora echinospora TaxID=1877 RepID=UPI003CF9034C
MHLPFSLQGMPGRIDVRVSSTDHPEELGAGPGATGLAHCEATVSYPGQGYSSLLGWIQLVRSTDNSSGGRQFEMDPLEILGDLPHPFCFFGFKPTLFDAPSRDSRADLDWLAHSFLCRIADEGLREIHALAGFAWGFATAAGVSTPTQPRRLKPAEWSQHLDLLHAAHPSWRFADGYENI